MISANVNDIVCDLCFMIGFSAVGLVRLLPAVCMHVSLHMIGLSITCLLYLLGFL